MQEAFAELEQMLFQGVLTDRVTIHGLRVTLKTLTPREFAEMTDWLGGDLDSPSARLRMLTVHVLSLDGREVVSDRWEDPMTVYDALAGLPLAVVEFLLERCHDLTRRSYDIASHLHPYCYTSRSRQKWQVYRDRLLNDPLVTGIPGSAQWGLNHVQESWVAYNRSEDDRLAMERQYEWANYLGAFTNPEGAKKAFEDTKTRQDDLLRKRQAILDGRRLADVDRDDPDSVANLLDLLGRQMSGEKDDHDQFIESYFKEMLEQEAAREAVDPEIMAEFGVGVGEMSEEEFLAFLEAAGDSDADNRLIGVVDREGSVVSESRYRSVLGKLGDLRGS